MAIIKTGVKHYKMSELQKKILLEFCNESSLTKTDLKNNLKKFYSDINDSIKILIDRGYIEKIQGNKEKNERGKAKVFYILTLDGVKEVLEIGIELEEFWKLIFYIVKLNRFPSVTIKEIFTIYEKNYYKFSKDLVTPIFDSVVSICNQIKKQEQRYNIYIKILKLLVNEKALTIKEIITKLDIPKSKISKYYTGDEKNPGQIDMMIRLLFIEKISKTNSKYRISSVGTILLFDKLYDELKNETISMEVYRELIENFRINCKIHYPIIFKNWNIIRNIIGDRELISCFRYILNFENLLISGERMQNGGLYEFFNILQSMRRTYSRKLEKELKVGRKVWIESTKKDFEPGKAENLLTFAMLNQFSEPKKVSELVGWDNIVNKIAELAIEAASIDFKESQKAGIPWHMLNEAFKIQKKKKSLENLITLQFFTLVFYHVRIKQNMIEFIQKHQNEQNVKNDFEENRKRWNLFLDSNKDYVKLFGQQISQIVSFENENIRLISKLGNFDIESYDSKELDLDILRQIVQSKSE